MHEIDLLHDWLMRSWFGVLTTAIIGGIATIVLWNLSARFVGWFATTVPATYRTLSYQATISRINYLRRIENDSYQLTLALIFELVNFSVRVIVGSLLMMPMVAYEVHTDARLRLHPEMKLSIFVFVMAASLVIVVLVSLSVTAVTLLRLYQSLRSFDGTLQRLQRHLIELEARQLKSQE
jgi:hypothetical protein